MKKSLTYFGILIAQLLIAQENYKFTTSGEYFNKAYEHLEKQEFYDAFVSFDKINKSDTLYALAQLNKLIAQYTAGFYKEAVETGGEMIDEESTYESEGFFYKTKALIDLKNYNDALECIHNAVEKYPLYRFRFKYLKALMLKMQGKYEEAKRLLQSILIHNPNHSDSHLLLAQITGEEGGELQSILGFQMAIISNRNSTSIRDAYRGMSDIMQGNFDINREKKEIKHYQQINSLISSGLALKGNYNADLSIKYITNVVTDLIFKQLNFLPNSEDFTMQYYVKFLNEVKKRGLQKGYILYVMSIIDNPSIKKAMITYKDTLEAFEKFKIKYWNNQINSNKYFVNGVIDEREYITNKKGVLTAFGKRNEDDFKTGKWTYFYPSGKIAAQTEYDKNGKLRGENIWYSKDGYIVESGIYEAGKLNGVAYFTRENGCSSYEGEFIDGKLHGEVKIYNDKGIFYMSKNFKNNKADGLVKEFYQNGQLASTINLINGLKEGKHYVFSPLGDTLKIKSFSKGKAIGALVEFHENGNVFREGEYKGGKRYGEWKEYYYDGSLAYKYNYKSGNLHGDYLKFGSNGDTMAHKIYNNGLLHGLDKDYIKNNKILWKHIFKNGKLKKYYNYSPDGVLISKGKKDYLLNDRFGFRYIEGTKKGNKFHGEYKIYWKNGKIKEKRNYIKGTLSGEFKAYYSWGAIDEEKYYKNDKLHGEYKSYYDNGNLYAEGQYIGGDKTGLWTFYHPNGNLFQEIYYIDGESEGHVTFYSITGEKRSNYFYKGNVLYKSEVFNDQGNIICSIKTPQGKGDYIFNSVSGHVYLKSRVNGGEHHGIKLFYYPNGQIIERVEKNHGESHGVFKSYFPDGKIKEIGEYVFGKKKGVWKSYYHTGNISEKAIYKNDITVDSITKYYITGELKEIEYYNKNGESKGVKYFHSNGTINCFSKTEGGFVHGEYSNYDAFGELVIKRLYNGGECLSYNYMKNGKLIEPVIINGNGLIKTYYDNGKPALEFSEKDGLNEGAYLRNYSNGEPWIQASYLHGKIHGNYKLYFTDGSLRHEAEYDFGRLNGLQKRYNGEGKLLSEITFNQGVRDGLSKFYDNKGNLLYILLYKDDVVIDVKGL